MLRFQLGIRPAKISTPHDAEKRMGIRYATISTDTTNDASISDVNADQSARISRPALSMIVHRSLNEKDVNKKKACQKAVGRMTKEQRCILKSKSEQYHNQLNDRIIEQYKEVNTIIMKDNAAFQQR